MSYTALVMVGSGRGAEGQAGASVISAGDHQ